MPRRARIIVPNLPHHIVQRGHNRNAVFMEERDYRYYLKNLAQWKEELGIKVYSYCLMTNHVHIIVGVGDTPSDVGSLMKRVAGRQTRLVNRVLERTGSLWDSRYFISPIDTRNYLLNCLRYVELNPVKAGMVRHPGEYLWSSFRAHTGMERTHWLDPFPLQEALGQTKNERRANYRAFVEDLAAAKKEHDFLQKAINRNQLTGGPDFVDDVERMTGVRVEPRGPGRPRKKKK